MLLWWTSSKNKRHLQPKLGQDDWLWDRENHHDSWHFENLGQQQVTWRWTNSPSPKTFFIFRYLQCFMFWIWCLFVPILTEGCVILLFRSLGGSGKKVREKNHQSRRMMETRLLRKGKHFDDPWNYPPRKIIRCYVSFREGSRCLDSV